MAETKSILGCMKAKLGLPETYTPFDKDIIDSINGIFMVLSQLGIGSAEKAFTIRGPDETWEDYLGEHWEEYSAVSSYMYIRLRQIFDPPSMPSVLTSFKEQQEELAFRLIVQAKEVERKYGTG
jgi:hypothetical protein